MFKQSQTIILKQSDLLSAGIDLSALGGTNHKNRPYMIVTSNRQMTWLVPLTTKMKRSHGRKQIVVKSYSGENTVEAVCSDMYNIQTSVLERIAIKHGSVVTGARGVLEQLAFQIMHGRLGVYPDGGNTY